MNKRFSILFLVVSISIFGANNEIVNATSNNLSRPFEEIYPEIGYKTVEEAVTEFEQHFKKELKLPLRVPPLNFTHYFGRFNDLDGDINDSFEIEFISDKSPENHYKIDVRPVKYKIPIRDKYKLKAYELKNGNEAIYMNVSGFYSLVFEKDNWQYMFSIDKRVTDKVPPKVLVNIANSIDYLSEVKKPLD